MYIRGFLPWGSHRVAGVPKLTQGDDDQVVPAVVEMSRIATRSTTKRRIDNTVFPSSIILFFGHEVAITVQKLKSRETWMAHREDILL